MPRQSRSSRRSRPRRPSVTPRPTQVAASPAAESVAPAPPAAAPSVPTARVVRPTASPGSLSRGFVTDYNYVIGELKRILLLTAGILLVLLVLWLILG